MIRSALRKSGVQLCSVAEQVRSDSSEPQIHQKRVQLNRFERRRNNSENILTVTNTAGTVHTYGICT